MDVGAFTILLVDDDETFRRVTEMQLTEQGFVVRTAASAREGIEIFEAHRPDLILTDIRMPDRTGIEFLGDIKARDPHVLVVVMTAYADVETTITTFKGGAYDFLTKPFSRNALMHSLTRALQFLGLQRENRDLRKERTKEIGLRALVGTSTPMTELRQLIQQVAKTSATVLISGESGTGKELIARAIHEESGKAGGPFVAVHCGALPESLIESELFGHVKGAFTGADHARKGQFEAAHGGTIFLDEIGSMPLGLQQKLLRVLQEREVRRVGGTENVKVNFRVIAATNADIERMITRGDFREDLYYRLNVVRVHAPPLRDRTDDIPLIVAALLRRAGRAEMTLSPDARDALSESAWPGNVRELENVLERALIGMGTRDMIEANDLPPLDERSASVRSRPESISIGGVPMELPSDGLSLEAIDKGLIEHALETHAGNRTHAAKYLGITRQTLLYRLQKYGLGES